MSDSVRPHRRQPTRLPCPWDSPGKNTGVGCHFFLQCMKVKSESEVTQSCPTLSNPMDCSPPGSSVYGVLHAWTGLPCLSPGDHPDPGIKAVSPVSSALLVNSLPPEPPEKPILVETLANYLTSLCFYFFIHKMKMITKST